MTTTIFQLEDRNGVPIPTQYTVNPDGSFSPNIGNPGSGGGGGGGGSDDATADTVWVDDTSGTAVYYIRREEDVGGTITVSWFTPGGASASPTVANLSPFNLLAQAVSSVDLGTKADSAATSDSGTFSLISLTKRLLGDQTTANTSLATIAAATSTEATAALQATANTALATLHTDIAGLNTLETAGNASLSSIATNTAAGSTAANQVTGNTSLATLATASATAAKDGTDATGVTPPPGAAGIRGWLSAIYSKLMASVAVTGVFWPYSLGQQTTANSIPVVQASNPDVRPGAQSTTVVDSGSTTTAGNNSVNYITGTPTPGSVFVQAINGLSNVSLAVTAITGTVTFELSNDGGTTWVGATMRQRGAGYTAASATGVGIFEGDVGGKTHFRVRQTVAGAATFTPTFTSLPNGVQIMNPVKIFDNASGSQASIKPASTASVATDTALVVAVSPNNSVAVTQVDAPSVINASATSAAVLFDQDTTGYNSISVQTTSAGTNCTITYEGSNDNITFYPQVGIAGGFTNNTYISATTIVGVLTFPVLYRYFRARVSTYGSGTVTVVAYLRVATVPVPFQDYVVSLYSSSGNQTTTVADSASTTTSGYNGVSVITGTPTTGSFYTVGAGGSTSVSISVSAITSTLVFECSVDNVNWVAMYLRQRGGVGLTSSTTGIGVFEGDIAGKTNIRVRQTAAGSATFVVLTTGATAPSPAVLAVQGASGGAAVTVTESDALLVSSTSQSSAAVLFSQDTTGYNSVSVQVTSAGTSCTITYEGSNDNTTWYSVIGIIPANQANAYVSATNTLTAAVFPCMYRYFRARVSTYGSGTVTVVAYLRSASVLVPNQIYAFVSGGVSVTSLATTNLQTLGDAIAPATPAASQIKSSAGRLYWMMVGNSGASDVWVKIFNATSVTLGTTSATLNLYVPKGTSQNFVWADIGAYFATGIVYAVTGGISLTDNTSITASTVTLSFGYV